MTARELQRIAVRLSNQFWCRHWLNYGDRHEDILMAIQCRDESGKTLPIPELSGIGFTDTGKHLWTIPRTNPDGTPFISGLF